MERKGPPIPLDEFRRRFGNQTNPEGRWTRIQQISAVQLDTQQLVHTTQKQWGQISEDAYATRNEVWKHVTFLGEFSRKIAKAKPGDVVDLTKK